MERTNRRLNSLDWILLTVLAAAVVLTAFLLTRRERAATPDIPIVCVLCLPASERMPDVNVGDAVRNENGTVRFGEVTDVVTRPLYALSLRDGNPVYSEEQGMIVTEVTVRMVALRTTDYRVGDIRVCAGETGSYRIGQMFAAGVTVVSVVEEGLS